MNQYPNGRRTQEQRRADSERRLLAATAELVVDRGFAGLSLAAIGERAGCSHALVNHLFGSKAALIERLKDEVDDLYRRHISLAVQGREGVDAVVALTQGYLCLVTSDDPVARVHVILWAQAVAGSAELRDSRVEWDRHFRAGVAEVIAQAIGGSGDDAFPETTSFVIVGLLRGIVMQHLLDPTGVPLTAAIEGVADAVRGLLGRADAKLPLFPGKGTVLRLLAGRLALHER